MQIFFSEYFKRQLKRLKKRFPRAKDDLLDVMESLNIENEISVGRPVYKIRKGKSGGFRAYIYLYRKKDLLVPLCIYAKSDKESITDNELKFHFDNTIEELMRSFLY